MTKAKDWELEKNIKDLEYQTFRSRHRLSLGLFFTVLFGILSLGEDFSSFLGYKILVLEISLLVLGLTAYQSWRSMLQVKKEIRDMN